MSIDKDKIKHVAKLARISLDEKKTDSLLELWSDKSIVKATFTEKCRKLEKKLQDNAYYCARRLKIRMLL